MGKEMSCIAVDGRGSHTVQANLIEEVPYAIFVNGRHVTTTMTGGGDPTGLVIGYLFTEQIIREADEIESVRTEKNRVSVITKNLFKAPGPKKTILSGCGGSTSFIDPERLPKIQSELTLSPDVIRDAVTSVLSQQEGPERRGLSCAVLHDGTTVLARGEDIGRHNAVDRVIGTALESGIDCSNAFLILSDRISSEIVRKCLLAGIPVLVTCDTITALAAEIAQGTGLTVIGNVHGGRMDICSHPERVIGMP
jgi:FdhD protein